jgi:hypothetical protein
MKIRPTDPGKLNLENDLPLVQRRFGQILQIDAGGPVPNQCAHLSAPHREYGRRCRRT